MNSTIRIGIVGYGNLGRGVEIALSKAKDLQLIGIFSRRPKNSIQSSTPIYSIESLSNKKADIDVLILCGGSKSDLPIQGPQFAADFNTVDSFDTHAKIPEYFDSVNKVATTNQKTALISVGWDPGLFSLNRLFGESILTDGETYTFWGKGVSQGHSDAIRRIDGVKNAVQYTIPEESVINQIRSGNRPQLSTRQKHRRECYVVLNENANSAEIEKSIVTMPDYFADYNTTVHFITEQELQQNHSTMPHGGFVIRSGKSSESNSQTIEYSLKLDSNPEFTASVLVAYSRATYRLNQQSQFGAKTVFDVPPALLSPKSAADLRKQLL
ncbi:MAG: diaminopimelate dehydrogenase [Leptonema sp. (in: Bacteria)]|nr:diaminopimelate dehydrogenase [Leptonema sp. (in: bacteria)]